MYSDRMARVKQHKALAMIRHAKQGLLYARQVNLSTNEVDVIIDMIMTYVNDAEMSIEQAQSYLSGGEHRPEVPEVRQEPEDLPF